MDIGHVTAPGADPDAVIDRALAAVRDHLGMAAAYLSRFEGDDFEFTNVDAPGLEAMLKPGDRMSLDDVYCRHILAGRLPELIPDTAAQPICQDIAITRQVPIGAHVSVPIRLPDGSPYGMFCCLSPTPNASLNERDLSVLRAFADLAAQHVHVRASDERKRIATRAALDKVFAQGGLEMWLQPIVDLGCAGIVGFESLARFQSDPPRPPNLWFDDARTAGMCDEVETRALRSALAIRPDLPPGTYLSINATPDFATQGGLATVLMDEPLENIVIEITEHAAVADYHGLIDALTPLRLRGAAIAVDDAGAGYASLAHIVRLRPDVIKLDMSLVRGIDGNRDQRALAQAMATFAAEIGARLIAEGIETEAERTTLQEIGLRYGQGYLLGRPAPADRVLATCRQPHAPMTGT